jgi:hypothetical protein
MREITSANDVYDTFGAMMRFIASAPACEPWLREVDETWRFLLSEPDAQVSCLFLANGPLEAQLGSSRLTADTTISLRAADANAYLLGELNVFLEIDQGRVVIDGSPTAFLRTVPRMSGFLAQAYREVLLADTPPDWLRQAQGSA